MLAQIAGALCGAACLYATYFHAIDIFEGGQGIRTVSGTAGLFATYAVRQSVFIDNLLIKLLAPSSSLI